MRSKDSSKTMAGYKQVYPNSKAYCMAMYVCKLESGCPRLGGPMAIGTLTICCSYMLKVQMYMIIPVR